MKKRLSLLVVIFLASITTAFGVLPPLYQSTGDLSKIAEILNGLGRSEMYVKSVDLNKFSATMGSGNKTCQILFQRKVENHPPGWAGPAAPLEIKSNNCK